MVPTWRWETWRGRKSLTLQITSSAINIGYDYQPNFSGVLVPSHCICLDKLFPLLRSYRQGKGTTELWGEATMSRELIQCTPWMAGCTGLSCQCHQDLGKGQQRRRANKWSSYQNWWGERDSVMLLGKKKKKSYLQLNFTMASFPVHRVSGLRFQASGKLVTFQESSLLKALGVSFVTQVTALYLKITWHGYTREPLKDTAMYSFDLCARNRVRVTTRNCKRWGRVTSVFHLPGCTDFAAPCNPKEGDLKRRSWLCKYKKL